MPVDLSNTPSIRLNPTQELKLTKPDTELYVGQILKAVVVKSLTENQVLINIDGENINAQTSQHLEPGDLLQLKVIKTEDGTIVLQVLREPPPLTPMEAALAKTLPKQAPATHLFATLAALDTIHLPDSIRQQINELLISISSITQLPQQLSQAIANCGLFWEANLFNWRRNGTGDLQNDFKRQCLRLLHALMNEGVKSTTPGINSAPNLPQRESLPLPGAIPQPMHQLLAPSFTGKPISTLLELLYEQTDQVLARIKTAQLTNLLQPTDQALNLMLDLPLKTPTGIDVIPIQIKEHRQETPSLASSWSISFAVNLPGLGDIQARVKMQDMAIDIQINAEQQNTVALLNSHQQAFDNLLSSVGLTLRLWNLHLGLEDHEVDIRDLRLLDIHI
ncbi:flagellar hook-length control protein FliK [Legionella micdadei]|uniref:Hook-length control protein FliK n=1 Tax=Legionella micdadei TaxID=451 RepID=A0A098GB51_LEGMI|nr:flagellar hook-length control protein FliK [Legionella micdadei]ARG96495.1 flagellar hook-length control protein FliK [Legionella micdadei]ARG99245.1 flagellar hook-length control protein FliK [Legionella micdadei]KTD27881.1 Flagellar hook-length control protein FliK [Legionella micdadei]CEG59714.1 conserved protein of unknown function [Legionella micdadei]SCY79898.1 hook-length control protein FliK [Legionella micdadei]